LAVVTGTTNFCKPSGGGSACWPGSKALHLIDLATQEATLVDPGFGRVGAMAFSPDGRQLALVHEAKDSAEARLYDPTDGRLLRSAPVPFVPDYFGYSADGKGLILLGADAGKDLGLAPPGPLTTLLIDATSLEVIWQQALDGVIHGSWCLEGCDGSFEGILFANWWPAIVRIPGSDRLVIVHADGDRLTSIDAMARRVTTMDITSPHSWLDRLMALGTTPAEAKGASEGAFREAVVSADGSRLYVVGSAYHARRTDDGMWDIRDEPLGLQVIDPATGSLIRKSSDAGQVALTSDEPGCSDHLEDVRMSTMILVAELDSAILDDRYLIPGESLTQAFGFAWSVSAARGLMAARSGKLDRVPDPSRSDGPAPALKIPPRVQVLTAEASRLVSGLTRPPGARSRSLEVAPGDGQCPGAITG
jgi:hypothetical protein